MNKQEEESKQEDKGGFPRCTFRTNLVIGFCVSFLVMGFLTFTSLFPFNADCFILKKIAFVLVLGILSGFIAGGFSWLIYDFE